MHVSSQGNYNQSTELTEIDTGSFEKGKDEYNNNRRASFGIQDKVVTTIINDSSMKGRRWHKLKPFPKMKQC